MPRPPAKSAWEGMLHDTWSPALIPSDHTCPAGPTEVDAPSNCTASNGFTKTANSVISGQLAAFPGRCRFQVKVMPSSESKSSISDTITQVESGVAAAQDARSVALCSRLRLCLGITDCSSLRAKDVNRKRVSFYNAATALNLGRYPEHVELAVALTSAAALPRKPALPPCPSL